MQAARALLSPRRAYRKRLRLRRTASGRSLPYNLRFPGQYYDSETGLTQNWNRDYDPIVARYIESDPLGLKGGINTYAYARSNPVWYRDPLGLFITSVDAACVIDPSFCAEIMGQMVQNAAAISQNPCMQEAAEAVSGALNTLADIGTFAALLPIARWGNPESLLDHFDRHGADFGAKSPQEYAQQASNFLERSQLEGLPTKIDSDGVMRVYDPATNTFGAFNPDGTARTLFKPTSPTYFARQPGTLR